MDRDHMGGGTRVSCHHGKNTGPWITERLGRGRERLLTSSFVSRWADWTLGGGGPGVGTPPKTLELQAECPLQGLGHPDRVLLVLESAYRWFFGFPEREV